MGRVDPLPSRRVLLTTETVLLIMLVVGSFADYPISLALYHGGSLLERLLAGFGEYPAALGLATAGQFCCPPGSRKRC